MTRARLRASSGAPCHRAPVLHRSVALATAAHPPSRARLCARTARSERCASFCTARGKGRVRFLRVGAETTRGSAPGPLESGVRMLPSRSPYVDLAVTQRALRRLAHIHSVYNHPHRSSACPCTPLSPFQPTPPAHAQSQSDSACALSLKLRLRGRQGRSLSGPRCAAST
jgi:hypothetical protein